ncbi:DinB family protein [Zhongshania aquimaris]|uniref:DinB family protein n=1 Tax=Zhongshania aquimaris TaxID=2857107 RepID=A0ABS6VRZ4_9GAMM|nr:DinB family protein [Zhongshania aquimaris]MBW2941083.1 DinB family protein [Zhongshania aquimaris]
MGRQQQFELMGRYNRDMNQRLYAAAATMDEDQLASNVGAFFHSIIGTLNHLYVADVMWLQRFAVHHFSAANHLADVAAMARPTALNQVLHEDFEELFRVRRALDTTICAWTENLQEVSFDRPLTYKNSKGHDFCKPFGLVLQHFFNHQAHHRGQVTTLLSQQGVDVGVTDLLLWIEELPFESAEK